MNYQNSQQLTIQQALSRAKKAFKQGKIADAVEIYTAILQQQPNHPIAKKALRKLQKGLPQNQSLETETSSPSQGQINSLVNLYQSGQMIKTEQACRDLLQIYPQSLVVMNVLGLTLRGRSKFQEAVQTYNRAIQLKPDFAEAYSNLGNTLNDLGRLDEALQNYDKAIRLKPDFAEAHFNRGNTLKNLGRLDEALQNFDKTIRLKPDFAEAHFNRGNTLKELGRLDEALQNYDKAIRLKPDFAEAHSNRGITLKELGRLNEAVESCDKAIQLKPDFAEAHSNRGYTLNDLGRLDEALVSCDKAIRLKPDFAEAHFNRGNTLKDLGRLDEALQNYDKAIRLKPDFAEAHFNRGNTLKDLGRLDEALQNYDKAIRLKPDFAKAHYNMGTALHDKEEPEAAIESYKKAIKIEPQYAEAHNNMGVALHDKKQLEAAIESYKKAIKIEPQYTEAHNNMGVALHDKKEPEAAIESYKKVIKIEPQYTEARTNLAGILEEHGKYQEAIRHYDLSNTAYSKAKALQCLYISGCYSEFKDRLDKLAESSDINIRVAAVSAFVTHQLKLKDPYPFCKNSLDFLHVGNLNDHIFDVGSFIENLILEASKESQVWEPKNKTTKFGFQTASTILKTGKNCMALEKILRKEIDSYHSKYRSEDCVFINSWPSEYNLEGWFVRLVKNGHQNSHIHPAGWLSGVVYLKTIDSLDTDDGSIELGLHGYNLPILDDTYPRKIHRPKPGDIVLFPSSLFHRTIPFNQDAERCVIAFDLSGSAGQILEDEK